MKSQLMLRRIACGIVFFLACGRSASAGPPATEKPQPLPKEIVDAWKEAGFEVGWMRIESGFLFFLPEENGSAGDLPAFALSQWKAGLLPKLPVPQTGFGLELSSSEVTDTGLKELSRLKSLQILNLAKTEITDAGLKELRGLKNLQSLKIAQTMATDAGMKELAALESLRTLDLGATRVTDAGLKLLADLTNLHALNLSNTSITDAGLKEL